MELYIVFYQQIIDNHITNQMFSVCNDIKEVERKYLNFVKMEQDDRRMYDSTLECNIIHKDDYHQITSKDDYFYNAVVSYSRIPFNVSFSLEELIK